MEYLEVFSLKDVGIVLTGLIIASIIRIYYDSHVTKQKAEQFGNSLGIYNSLLDDTKEGLFIIDDNHTVIYTNAQAADILETKMHNINQEYLETVFIQAPSHYKSSINILDVISTKEHIPDAQLLYKSQLKPISISINKFEPFENNATQWSIVILQDTTNLNELREGASNLLAA